MTNIPLTNSLGNKLINNLVHFAIYHEADQIQLLAPSQAQKINVCYFNTGEQLSTWSLPEALSQALWSKLLLLLTDGDFLIAGPTGAIHCKLDQITSPDGESLIIKLIQPTTDYSWSNAQFDADTASAILDCLTSKGIGIISCPQAGQTARLAYILLNSINDEQKCLASLESPIIKKLPQVNQCHWQEGKGFSYQRLFELILAQDPDVIYASDLTRLNKHSIATAGSAKFVIAGSNHASPLKVISELLTSPDGKQALEKVRFILSVHTVKQNCPHCLTPLKLSNTDINKLSSITELSPEAIAASDFASSQGCKHCNFQAFDGEMPLYDVMLLTPSSAKELSRQRLNKKTIQMIADTMHLNALEDAWLKAQSQLISPLEIIHNFECN